MFIRRKATRGTGSFTLLLALTGIGIHLNVQAKEFPPDVIGWQEIVLTPKQLPELKGQPLSAIRLYSWSAGAGRWNPIPFQIDEVDSNGRYILPEGPMPQRSDGRFDGRDELLWLERSLGAVAPPDAPSPCEASTQPRLLLPLSVQQEGQGGNRGTVYAATCSPSTPYSLEDLAKLDAQSGRVETEDHGMTFQPAQPMEPTSLVFKRRYGGTGQNMLHALYVEGRTQFLVGLVKLRRSTEDFVSSTVAWKDGPIRVIRRTAPRIRTFGQRYTNRGTFSLDSIHQPGVLSFDLQMHTSTDLGSFLTDLQLTVAWDFQDFHRMEVLFSSPIPSVTADGVMTKEERGLKEKDAGWIFVRGPVGTYTGTLRHQNGLRIDKHLFYQDMPGGRLRLGYTLSGLHRVGVGKTWYRAEFLNLNGGDYSAAARLMQLRRSRWTRVP